MKSTSNRCIFLLFSHMQKYCINSSVWYGLNFEVSEGKLGVWVVHSVDSHQPFGECFCTYHFQSKYQCLTLFINHFLYVGFTLVQNQERRSRWKRISLCHFYFLIWQVYSKLLYIRGKKVKKHEGHSVTGFHTTHKSIIQFYVYTDKTITNVYAFLYAKTATCVNTITQRILVRICWKIY